MNRCACSWMCVWYSDGKNVNLEFWEEAVECSHFRQTKSCRCSRYIDAMSVSVAAHEWYNW